MPLRFRLGSRVCVVCWLMLERTAESRHITVVNPFFRLGFIKLSARPKQLTRLNCILCTVRYYTGTVRRGRTGSLHCNILCVLHLNGGQPSSPCSGVLTPPFFNSSRDPTYWSRRSVDSPPFLGSRVHTGLTSDTGFFPRRKRAQSA